MRTKSSAAAVARANIALVTFHTFSPRVLPIELSRLIVSASQRRLMRHHVAEVRVLDADRFVSYFINMFMNFS